MLAGHHRYAFTGILSTNGPECRPLAYKLTRKKNVKSVKFLSGPPLSLRAVFLRKRLPTKEAIEKVIVNGDVVAAGIDPGHRADLLYQKNLETMKKDASVNATEKNIFKWDPQQHSSENSNTFWSTY
ncbi:hypothetical protein BGZ59_004521 [Podila verticillata]|nr:hypothetical protein BGZ59_004521 [Podila verticillata]